MYFQGMKVRRWCIFTRCCNVLEHPPVSVTHTLDTASWLRRDATWQRPPASPLSSDGTTRRAFHLKQIYIKYGEEKKGLWGVSRHGEVGRDAPSHLLFNAWQPEHSNMRFWKVCFHKINAVFCSFCSSLMESRVAEGGGNGGERTGLRRKD